MSANPLLLTLQGRSVFTALRAAFASKPEWVTEPSEHFRRDFLDTFDWRLYERGQVLEWEEAGDGGSLLLYAPGRSAMPMRLRRDAPPCFIDDVPPGPIRVVLAPVLEMRALLPQLSVEGRRQHFRQVDGEGKTVLRLVLEQQRTTLPEGKKPRTAYVLRLLPVKGYLRPLRALLDWLSTTQGLRAERAPSAGKLLAAAHPGGYSAKVRMALDPAMPAETAVRAVLLQLLEIMQQNEAGTRADTDTEFLHDFRVSVRRTRTALTQLKSVFPLSPLARFRRGFAWLGTITSPTRDLDVYLLDFEGYRDMLPEALRGHLGPLHDFLLRHQRLEQQRLARALGGARYRKLVADWRRWLETPFNGRRPPPDALRPVEVVADERIWRMFRRVIKEGRAIGPESPATDLHELRKSCKKLRYLLEFFQSLYPPAAMKQIIRALKELQDHLGAFQDLEVQGHTLAHFAEQMQQEGEVPEPTLQAMASLVETLHTRQQFYRETFAVHFEAFSAKPNRRLFRKLFHPEPAEEEP